MASVPVYCLCQLPYDVTRFMIECDLCQQWFHGSCVGVEEEKAADIDLYHCPSCEILHGPSIMRKCQATPVVQELIVNKEVVKMAQTRSPVFIQELQNSTFDSNKKVNDLTRSRNSKVKLRVLTQAQPKLMINEKFDLDSKEELKIEETPLKEKAQTIKKKLPKFQQKLLQGSPCSDPKRIREPGEVEFDIEGNYTMEKNKEEGVEESKAESTGGACGILDLLKASRQIEGPDCVDYNNAPPSPSTIEAIQGMLCMANLQPVSSLPPASSFQAWWASEAYSGSSGSTSEKGGGPSASQGTMKKRTVKQLDNHSTEGEKGEVYTHEPENTGNNFKDEEYLYRESDEDDSVSKLRPKKKKKRSADDAPWIPKARVLPSLPKSARPVREGTIVSSVETRLTGTVAKLAQQEPFSGSLTDHEYTAQPKMAQVDQRTTPMSPDVFLSQQQPSASSHEHQMAQGKRPKKGLATVKQRLGRILKIHRHGKLLL